MTLVTGDMGGINETVQIITHDPQQVFTTALGGPNTCLWIGQAELAQVTFLVSFGCVLRKQTNPVDVFSGRHFKAREYDYSRFGQYMAHDFRAFHAAVIGDADNLNVLRKANVAQRFRVPSRIQTVVLATILCAVGVWIDLKGALPEPRECVVLCARHLPSSKLARAASFSEVA